MSICPNKSLNGGKTWKDLVDKIKDKFQVNEDMADKLAEMAFHINGDIPAFEDAERIISGGSVNYVKKTTKRIIGNIFRHSKRKAEADLGYSFGVAEGRALGASEQAKIDAKISEKVSKLSDQERKVFEAEREKLIQKGTDFGYEYGIAEGKSIGALEQAKMDAKELAKFSASWEAEKSRILKESEREIQEGTDYGYRFGTAEQKKVADHKEAVRKAFITTVSEYLKFNEKLKGKLSEKQIDSIIRKASKVGTSESSFNKFADYMDKVIQDANYEKNFNDAESFQSSLKKKLKESFPSAYGILKRMKNLNLEHLSPKEIDKFNDWAKKYDNSLDVKNPDYEPFDVKLADYVLQNLEVAANKEKVRLAEEEFGVKGLTSDEADVLRQYMESENPDEFSQNLEQEKKSILNRTMSNSLNAVHMGFNDWLETNKDKIESTFLNSTKNDFKELSSANLSIIGSIKDKADIIRILDNAQSNNTNENIGQALNIYKKYYNISKMQDAVQGLTINTVGNLRAFVEDSPVFLQAIFGNKQAIANIRLFTGYADFIRASSNSESTAFKFMKSYQKFKKSIKLGNDIVTQTHLFAYTHLIDVRLGHEAEDFSHNKAQIINTIERLSKSTKDSETDYAKTLKGVMDMIVDNDLNSVLKMYEGFDGGSIKQASEFLRKSFEGIKDRYEEFSIKDKGEPIDVVSRRNYHHVKYMHVSDARVEAGSADSKKSFSTTSNKAVETGVNLGRYLSKGALPDGQVLDINIELSTQKAYQQMLFEMDSWNARNLFDLMTRTSKDNQDVRNNFSAIFGGEGNANRFINEYAKQYELARFGKEFYNNPISGTIAMQTLRTIKNVGAPIALARTTQFLSQQTVLFNTASQAGSHLSKVLTTRGLGNIPLFDLTTVGYRAEEMGFFGRTEGMESAGYSLTKNKVLNFVNWTAQKTGAARELSMTMLVKSDVSAAKNSFLSYYLKYMNDIAGIKTTAKDLKTEHLKMDETRRLAISYAEQSVDMTQGASNKIQHAALKRNDTGDTFSEIAKSTFLPFNNFASNTKTRMIEDLYHIKNGNKIQKKEAALDLAGSVLETAAFQAVKVYLVGGVVRFGVKYAMKSAFGLGDEDWAVWTEKNFKNFYTGVTREILASGFGSDAENLSIAMLNRFSHWMMTKVSDETEQDYYTWLKKEPMFTPQYTPSGNLDAALYNSLGSYGIALRTASDAIQNLSSSYTGEVDDTYSFRKYIDKMQQSGKETTITYNVTQKKELNDNEKSYLFFLSLLQGASLLGYSEQDLVRAGQSIKTDILKSKSTPSTGGKSSSKFSLGSGGSNKFSLGGSSRGKFKL